MRDKHKCRYLLKQYRKCELCGNPRNLEIHHIIPIVCQDYGVDLDVEDNMIVICNKCHATLTPKSLLIKYGMAKKDSKMRNIKTFYDRCNEVVENPMDVYDVVDEVFGFSIPDDLKREA